MGGSSKSSSSNTNTTQQYDQRVAATDGGIAIGPSAHLQVDVVDAGVVDLAKTTVIEGGKLIANSLDAAKANTDLLFDFVEKRTQSEDMTLAQQAIKYIVPAIVGYALVRVMK